MSKINLLLIESSENDALIIADYLGSSEFYNFEIIHLQNLEEANHFLKEEYNHIDIILVNLFLPDSYGIHTFDELFKKYSNLPFLVLTEIKDNVVGVNAVKKGAQDFLIKSELKPDVLLRSISYAIERKKTDKELRKSEERYRELFEHSNDAIYISTVDGDFIDINPSGLKLFGYQEKDLERLKVKDLYVNEEDRRHLKEVLSEKGEVKDYELVLYKKGKKQKLNCLISTNVVHNENSEIVGYRGIIRNITAKKQAEERLLKALADLDHANKELTNLNLRLEEAVEERTMELKHEKELVEIQHKEIRESIQYAKRIQTSILPSMKQVKMAFEESFIYYAPKDIVSGDFYWFEQCGGKSLIAVVDCTGHGVPGAFMSIIGYTQLNEIVGDNCITSPGTILKELDKRVKFALNQNNKKDKYSKDGMELGIICYDPELQEIEYSGAMRPLYMIKKGELHIVKGNKFSIGGASKRKKEFITTRIKIERGDSFYLFSDGYPDQFGGPQGKKFMTKNVGDMLRGIAHLEIGEQESIVSNTISDWMKDEEQIDDILFIGLKY